MKVFDHPLWAKLLPYARFGVGRSNVDLLQLPDELRMQALALELPCVACGKPVKVFRARLKSGRSRISGAVEEHRLFYAATCPEAVNIGCSRSKAAKEHKAEMRQRLVGQRDSRPRVVLEVRDGSGAFLLSLAVDLSQRLHIELPGGARELDLVPVL